MITLDYALNQRPKVHNYDEKKHRKNVKFVQRKLDGFRCTIVCDFSTHIWAYGKKECYAHLLKKNHPAIYEVLQRIPRDTVVDCELWIPGVAATSVSSALREKNSVLKCTAFAIPFYKGADVRTASGFEADEWMGDLDFDFCPHIAIDQDDDSSLLEHFEKVARQAKLEGFILKDANYNLMYKVKPQKTVDLVVTEWFEGKDTGKYSGFMGGVRAGLHDKEGKLVDIAKVGGGWSDEQREDLEEDDVLGKVIEVEYQSVAAQGSLQFPRFLRFRDDKAPKQCTIDQLE